MRNPFFVTPPIDINALFEKYGTRLRAFALRRPSKDAKINLLVGSVRSGKTWALHGKIISLSANYPIQGLRVLTGQTKDTVYKNVLRDLFEIVGGSMYSYNQSSGELWLMGSQSWVMGARDEASEKVIRGATVGLAVCDELVLMPRNFFHMLLSRMSPSGSRLYASTNPDQPMHWLKTEYIDDPVLIKTGLVKTITVTMEDNPNLSEEFKNSLRALYKGLFYQRFILGQWVMAEGGIYRDAWNEELIYDDSTTPLGLYHQGGYLDRWIAADLGVDHPQVYGEFFDDGDTVWMRKEYFWDSNREMRQKTDAQYVDDLITFMGPNNACQVIIPPEGASFRAECVLRGLWVTDAFNEVMEGLQAVMGMMAKRKFRIHRSCKETIKGIETHVWNPNKAKRGIEEPMKQDDDAADMVRYGIASKCRKWRYAG